MIRALRATGASLRQLWALRHPQGGTHAPDYWLITILLTLVMFGTVMVFSASFALDLSDETANAYSYLVRQLIWVTVGLIGMLITYSIDYHLWRRFSIPGMVIALLLLVAVKIPGIGSEVLGAQRWIPLGPLSFQPSEVAKPILIIYLADWLAQKGAKVRQFNYGLVPFTIFLGLMIGLIMLQPDYGTAGLLAAVGVAMFLVAGADLFQFGLLSAAGVVAFLVMALSASYRRNRILAFLNPDVDRETLGWQLANARLALGSGGLFGLGLGASRQKFSWLPFPESDAIFAVVGEELGLAGTSFVLLLFIALAWRGYRIAKRAPEAFGALVAVGITTWMIFQAAINIGGITLTIPFTGIPLPFISYGGTSLSVSLAAMGILLNISRQTLDHEPEAAPARTPRRPGRPRPARSRAVDRQPVRPSAPRLTSPNAPYSTGAPRRGTRFERPVRSIDGRTQTRSGSFGRGQTRRITRSSKHWR